MPNARPLIPIALISLSAIGFAAYLGHEGWSDAATPPVKGDVPTYGFGTTKGPDGTPLKGGEKIAPPAAIRLASRDVQIHEGALKKCLNGVSLPQGVYDALVSLDANTGGVCRSTIPAKARAGDWDAVCKTILDFDKFCTKPKVGGKCPAGALKKLPGLTTRRQKEYRMCMGLP